jgi:hypothetical protein
MLNTYVVLQDSNTGRLSAIINALAARSAQAEFTRLRVAVAYASLSGCRELVRSLERNLQNWRRVRKEWLISIDFGRTDADALEYLHNLHNSEVAVPDAAVLLENTLIPERCFHPKTFILDSAIEPVEAPFSIFVGSANLTLSGLRTGVEHGVSLVWLPPLTAAETRALRELAGQLAWWQEAWTSAARLTPQLLRQYRDARPQQPREDTARSVRAFASAGPRVVENDPGIEWANAKYLWVQTHELYKNFGPGRAGNQLDLRRGTRVYFGFSPKTVPTNTGFGDVTLQYENMPPSVRRVRFGDNSMDKVNLPIPDREGPPSYDHAVVRFQRIGPKRFRLKLGSVREATAWQTRSREQNMNYRLAGGREFGFYN